MRRFQEDICLVLAGEAGQGIQTIEALLTHLLKESGFHVFATKEYMSRVRGGTNSTTIRVASHRITAFRKKIDILIPLHKDVIPRLKTRITAETLIIGERDSIGYNPMIDIPFIKLATELGNRMYANSLAIGLIAGLFGIDPEKCLQSISRYFEGKQISLKEKNAAAAQRGFEAARDLAHDVSIEIKKNESVIDEIMVTGGEAVALGALAGGCNYLCAYPMSPSTSVLTFMASYSQQFDIIVEQVEDEIGVVNMALGAWYAGARAMVTTSGGGFALMMEGISLCGMIESPLVVHLAQRPGPATGLPTRTEQGDLFLALYAGHGVFPRIILSPRDTEETFIFAQKAFDLADRYQCPVFILTDQYLMDTYYNMPRWTTENLQKASHIVETRQDYLRYKITDSGISSRGIPGFGSGIVCVDSDEHDEGGAITEDHAIRNSMVEKRLRKGATIRENAPLPSLMGAENFTILVVGWGSTFPMIFEALKTIGRQDIAHLHFSWVYPLPDGVSSTLERAEKVIVVEGNAAAHFAQLLKQFTECRVMASILKYDGLPFSVEELADQINRHLQA